MEAKTPVKKVSYKGSGGLSDFKLRGTRRVGKLVGMFYQ